jgi:hypothetical protein
MGVQEIIGGYLRDLEPSVKLILAEVILAEQAQIDLEKPKVKDRIRDAIDAEVRKAELESIQK